MTTREWKPVKTTLGSTSWRCWGPRRYLINGQTAELVVWTDGRGRTWGKDTQTDQWYRSVAVSRAD